MNTEDKLKDLILRRYHSVREFTLAHDIPYTTVHSIFRRGIGNSSVSNIIKICKALGISVDALANGEIKPANEHTAKLLNDHIEVMDLLDEAKSSLIFDDTVTLNGKQLSKTEVESIVNALEIGVEIAKRTSENHNKNGK